MTVVPRYRLRVQSYLSSAVTEATTATSHCRLHCEVQCIYHLPTRDFKQLLRIFRNLRIRSRASCGFLQLSKAVKSPALIVAWSTRFQWERRKLSCCPLIRAMNKSCARRLTRNQSLKGRSLSLRLLVGHVLHDYFMPTVNM